KLPDVVKMLPMDKMLLETDCPYLAPEPFRGKLCHSAMIYYTAEKIAEIKDISLNEILEKTAENSKKLFGL
ncbi:MAG: TatD family hydrolase, partial [Acutalibacteraceae bacterium]|nr:TatD family hydrolase [Acutalibacteraceae bacterium]